VSLDLTAVSPAASPTTPCAATPSPTVALTRTPAGWAVVSPAGVEAADGLVEGMCLADLVVEELGGSTDPDRSARRSARGPQAAAPAEDPRDARLAALERTVAQLEHALAARVSTERAIGVLVERHGVAPREAFDRLRQAARSQGRPVTELAREVLDSLVDRLPSPSSAAVTDAARQDGEDPPAAPAPRPPSVSAGAAVVDGRS
jgi:hypothetical protein